MFPPAGLGAAELGRGGCRPNRAYTYDPVPLRPVVARSAVSHPVVFTVVVVPAVAQSPPGRVVVTSFVRLPLVLNVYARSVQLEVRSPVAGSMAVVLSRARVRRPAPS